MMSFDTAPRLRARPILAAALACATAMLTAATVASAQQPSPDSEAIVKKLLPDLGPTRSIRRGIVTDGKVTAASVAQISLSINFEYRSADIMPSGKAALDALGAAMKDKRLDGATFRIVGHTDARGSAEYNLELSMRRAEAVRAYIAETHSVKRERLIAEGRGHTEPADTTRPFHEVNRRVQIYSVWQNPPTN